MAFFEVTSRELRNPGGKLTGLKRSVPGKVQ